MSKNKEVVLSVKDLTIHFSTDHGYVQAVRGISFDLYKGETLCIVGESGSGKSVTSKSIMGILSANGRIKGGSIMYQGEDLTKVSEDEFHRIRGKKIGMIFQDPLSSLNPIVRIGHQITESMLINNDRLKKMYEEKVSDELVAYKNALTERNAGIANAKDKIHFLKVDKEKVKASYILHHQSVAANMYKKGQEVKSNLTDLAGEYNREVEPLEREISALTAALKDQKENREANLAKLAELKARLADFKAKFNATIKRVKAEGRKEQNALRVDRSRERLETKAACKEIEKDYNQQIKTARQDYARIKRELHAQFDDEIKEKRDIFKAKSKVAKAEVKAYAAKLKADYIAKRDAIKVKLPQAHTEHAKATIKQELLALKEKYIASLKITKKEAKEKALEIMAEVGIPQPEKRFKQYPFEFSGGMRQRIVIAIALTANPDILICDEPTTALDVTIQAQILELINKLKRERKLSVIFITHDLGVVANMADRVAVMYAGKIVEYGKADEIFYDPRHPYTWALLSSIPDVDSKERLEAIPGTPPNMIYPPEGDAFAVRSKYAMAIDFKEEPPFFKVSDSHYAATWLLDPRAPKVKMPVIVSTRIQNSLKAHAARQKEGK
ncbi:MAG TPA: ATP-binding cassette domain-containing protein [Bacilli bacterium]|nr:ATP-binding cassette domain-containing protein [Bacilli bacterium]